MRSMIKDESGFTLIEMMIVVAIIAVLTAVAIPKFNDSLALTNTTRVQADLQSLDTAIAMYRLQNGKLPNDLSDLDEYIDVDNVEAPSGDIYIDGVLTSNSGDEEYMLTADKQNASFMGKTRADFGRKKTAGSGE